MKISSKQFGVVLAVAACMPLTLQAHRQWMLPSSTILSGTDKWVTVDAAVSNELFYFDHVPLRLDNLVVIAPDGAVGKPENTNTGKYRSTFDVHLTQSGTYKLAAVNNTVMASYEENGETKRWRGTPEKFAKEVPAGAKNLQVMKMQSRLEVFVTSNKPTTKVLETTGAGLELAPITHPNDLVAGEEAKFALLFNGKPAANLAVAVIPGGIRYRDNLKEIKLTTDSEGKFSVKFPDAGMYWLNAMVQEGGAPRPEAAPSASGSGSGWQNSGNAAPAPRPMSGNRASYTATLEVLPQ